MNRKSSAAPFAAFFALAFTWVASADAAEKLQAPERGKIKVAFVMTEGATMIDFAGPWEVFQDTHVEARVEADKHPFELYTVGASLDPISTSGDMTVVPDYHFGNAPAPDVVVVGAQRGADALSEWLVAQHRRGAVLVSICTGVSKLAAAGLLDGREATTHHDYLPLLRERFPKVKFVESRRFVASGDRIYTAGGLSSGIDLALHLVELYYDRAIAEQVAWYMEYQSQAWKVP